MPDDSRDVSHRKIFDAIIEIKTKISERHEATDAYRKKMDNKMSTMNERLRIVEDDLRLRRALKQTVKIFIWAGTALGGLVIAAWQYFKGDQ